MKVELNTELENESYKVQVKELELDGRYLFIKGIVLDTYEKEAFEFEDSVDLSDFCWKDKEPDSDEDSGNEDSGNEDSGNEDSGNSGNEDSEQSKVIKNEN